MATKASRSTGISIGLVAIFFALLYFVPKLLIEREVKVTSDQNPSFIALPMEAMFPFLVEGSKTVENRTLKSFFSDSPKALIVNFWATWCPPCLEELPSLEMFHRQLKTQTGKNLPQLVTISVDEKKEDVFNLYKTLDFKPSFPVLYDEQGGLATKVGTSKFPETFLVDGSGKILHKWIGPQNWLSDDVLRVIEATSRTN